MLIRSRRRFLTNAALAGAAGLGGFHIAAITGVIAGAVPGGAKARAWPRSATKSSAEFRGILYRSGSHRTRQVMIDICERDQGRESP
jgi:hypothetical protein